MLQNRVDPLGNLIRTKARGCWTGTRGVIHNDQQEIVRPFKLKAWLTCQLSFKERKRIIMSPNRYTELFFLDEATAFAAGHRPCCECRRNDFNQFKSLWIIGNPGFDFDKKTAIKKIDHVLHEERINKNQSKIFFNEKADQIPNGTFILFDENPYLVLNGLMLLWTPFGYNIGVKLPADLLTVITPKSIVNTFKAGYLPQIANLP